MVHGPDKSRIIKLDGPRYYKFEEGFKISYFSIHASQGYSNNWSFVDNAGGAWSTTGDGVNMFYPVSFVNGV
jgi:hypothetical protein